MTNVYYQSVPWPEDETRPTVAIVQTTWFPAGESGKERLEAARRALLSWRNFGGARLRFHIADDASDPNLLDVFRAPYPNATMTSSPRLGCGGALNWGVQYVLREGIADVFLYMQDDWEMTEDYLDLTPSLALLNSGVADIVRLGPTHPQLRAHVVRTTVADAEWCLAYDWAGGGYVVGWRPALYHRRVFERFPLDGLEGLSAIEGERVWLERMAADPNPPRVYHAPNCTLAGPFRHIETVELGEDAPDVLTARYAGG